MRKIIKFELVTLLTAMSLTTQAQEMDTLKVQKDSVAWNESLKEMSVMASSIRTEGDRKTAFITKEMRRGARNTAQMLGNKIGRNGQTFSLLYIIWDASTTNS